MNTTTVAIILVLILAVGLYIGVSNFNQQYGVGTSGSSAGQFACEPDKASAAASEPVKFTTSLPEGSTYYWSAPDGMSSFALRGPLTVRYARAGTKTVSLFYQSGSAWRQTSCTVTVR